MSNWDKVREQFRYLVARRGVQNVADAIPAGRDTVYRLIKGETTEPTRAVRAGIERLVDEDKGKE